MRPGMTSVFLTTISSQMRTKTSNSFSPKGEKKGSEHRSVFGYIEPLWGQPGGGARMAAHSA